MHTVDLAHVGRGLHEELAAYIADQQDYYADEGVHVALRDGCGCGCGWDEERVRRGVTIGLGRALLSRLTDATSWAALDVNTHRPLFWFLARPGPTSLADQAGRRLTVHAPHTAPGCFTRIVLRRAGLDPDRDIHGLPHSDPRPARRTARGDHPAPRSRRHNHSGQPPAAAPNHRHHDMQLIPHTRQGARSRMLKADLTSYQTGSSSASEGIVRGRRTMSEPSKAATMAKGNRSTSRQSATSSGWTP